MASRERCATPLNLYTSQPLHLRCCATLFPMLRISKHSLVLLLLLVGCRKLKELPTVPGGPSGGGPIDPTATFTRVQNEIFTPTCAALGCHDPLGRQQGLILTAGRAYANVVNVP